MLKKVLCLAALLLGLAASAAAERQEWVDSTFDFGKPRRIYIQLAVPPEINNGIYEHQTRDIFYGKVFKEVGPKLAGKQKIFTIRDFSLAMQAKGIDLAQLYRERPQEAQRLEQDFIAANSDLQLTAVVLGFGVGTQYREGYYLSLPATDNFRMTDMRGNFVTGSVQSSRQQYIPSRNVPNNYACVFFEVKEVGSGAKVWTRVDDRARLNATVLNNTKPADLYGRIVGKYFSDFTGRFGKGDK